MPLRLISRSSIAPFSSTLRFTVVFTVFVKRRLRPLLRAFKDQTVGPVTRQNAAAPWPQYQCVPATADLTQGERRNSRANLVETLRDGSDGRHDLIGCML